MLGPESGKVSIVRWSRVRDTPVATAEQVTQVVGQLFNLVLRHIGIIPKNLVLGRTSSTLQKIHDTPLKTFSMPKL
jgi:hypothetical protein